MLAENPGSHSRLQLVHHWSTMRTRARDAPGMREVGLGPSGRGGGGEGGQKQHVRGRLLMTHREAGPEQLRRVRGPSDRSPAGSRGLVAPGLHRSMAECDRGTDVSRHPVVLCMPLRALHDLLAISCRSSSFRQETQRACVDFRPSRQMCACGGGGYARRQHG